MFFQKLMASPRFSTNPVCSFIQTKTRCGARGDIRGFHRGTSNGRIDRVDGRIHVEMEQTKCRESSEDDENSWILPFVPVAITSALTTKRKNLRDQLPKNGGA